VFGSIHGESLSLPAGILLAGLLFAGALGSFFAGCFITVEDPQEFGEVCFLSSKGMVTNLVRQLAVHAHFFGRCPRLPVENDAYQKGNGAIAALNGTGLFSFQVFAFALGDLESLGEFLASSLSWTNGVDEEFSNGF